MSTTLTVIVVIVIVIAVGLLRESFRTNAVNTWARNAGFTPVPAAEHDRERLVGWAKQFYPDNAAHWGIVLRSDAAGRETVIAEHEERRMSKSNKDRWHTLAVTRVPGLRLEAVRIVRAGSPAVQAVLEAATAPGRAVRDSLGIEVTEKPPAHPVGLGMWGFSSVKQDALAFWSSPAQAAAIDAWPHDDAELAVVDDYVLVRVPGLIATGRLDELLAIADAARALFTQAAARKD